MGNRVDDRKACGAVRPGFFGRLRELVLANHPRPFRAIAQVGALSLVLLLVEISAPFLLRDVVLSLSMPKGAFSNAPIVALLLFGASQLLRAVVSLLQSVQANAFQSEVLSGIRGKLARSVLQGKRESLGAESASSVVSGLATDLAHLETFLGTSLWQSLVQGLFFVAGVAALFVIHRPLAVIAFLPIPIALVLHARLLPRLRDSLEEFQLAQIILANRYQELLEGHAVITTSQAESRVLGRFEEDNERLRERSRRADFWLGVHSPLYELIGGLSLTLLLFAGYGLVVKENLEPATLLTFVIFLGYVYRPVFSSAQLVTSWQKTRLGTERILQRLDPGEEPVLEQKAVPPGGIRAEALCFAYADNDSVIQELSLDLPRGSLVGVTGPNGAGKSTLLRLLAGDLKPTAGRLSYGGGSEIPRESIAYLPQEPFLFDASVLENIQLCCPGQNRASILRCAEELGLAGSLRQFPRGLDTPVGVRGMSLSGGQRQKVSLLRFALRSRTSGYCFLDEPTSYIDLDSEQALVAALLGACKGATTVIVSHREWVLSLCSHLLTMGGNSAPVLGPRSPGGRLPFLLGNGPGRHFS